MLIDHGYIPVSSIPEWEIKNETMVFSASPQFAHDNGDWITKAVLFHMKEQGIYLPEDDTVIDTRVHMLKPGWLPAIGGWHCDAIPRGNDGQPDFDHHRIPDIKHYLFVMDYNTGSQTQFIDQDLTWLWASKTPQGKNVWGHHSEVIQSLIDQGVTSPFETENQHLYEFDAHDYHKAIPATGDGWRFFFRATVGSFTNGPFNEIRQQVQTYIPSEHTGW